MYIGASSGEVLFDEVQTLFEGAILLGPSKHARDAKQRGEDATSDYGLTIRHVPAAVFDVEATVTSPSVINKLFHAVRIMPFEEDEVAARVCRALAVLRVDARLAQLILQRLQAVVDA